MKKAFIPVMTLAALALIACNNQPASSHQSGLSVSQSASASASGLSVSSQSSSSASIIHTFVISNKDDIVAEWHLGEAPRSLEFELAPAANPVEERRAGNLTVVSSDPTIVAVNGFGLTALKVGEVDITVTYYDKTQTIHVAVEEALGEPDYAQKTLTQVMAIPAEELVVDGSNSRSKEAYLTKVKVAAIGNKKDGSAAADKYGNMWVVEPDAEEGAEPVQVYGSSASIDALAYNDTLKAYKFPGTKDYLDNPDTKGIKVGDILDVIAVRADYKTTPEISMVIRSVNGKLLSNGVRATPEVTATEYSANVAKQLITVTGKITGWKEGSTDGTKYGNFYMVSVDEEGEAIAGATPVYVYGATASTKKNTAPAGEEPVYVDVIELQDNGSFKFNNPQDWLTNEGTKDLAIGDMITLTGYRCDYKGTLELTGIVTKYIEPAVRPDPVAATIADLIAKTAPENDKTYTLSGIWEPNNPGKYGNGYLTDAETGKTIQVYGMSADASAIEFDGSTGEPVFKYTNKQDFNTNEKTKDLQGGELITVEAINAYYAAKSIPEISAVFLSQAASEAKYAVTVAEVEGGEAQVSKAADVAYGEEITVEATPASGYKLSKIEVENSWGKKTDITETKKFKAGCVNKVIPTFVAEAADPTAELKSVVTENTDAAALGTGLTAALNLDPEIFTVTYDKNGASADCAIRIDGVRMYATKQSTNGNKLTVTAATGYAIKSIEIAFDSASYGATAQVLVAGEPVAAVEGVYTINNEAFTLFNNNSQAASNTQVRFQTITITYAVANEK